MAKTNGDGSQPEGRERPITSVRKIDHWWGGGDVTANVGQGSFRGPITPSLLVSYCDYVSLRRGRLQ